MPEMNGIEVLKQLRTIDPQAAVMILTAWGSDALEKQARQLGVKDFLSKGLSLEVLVEAIQRTLPQPANAASPAEAPAPAKAPQAAPAAAGDGNFILVVDDEEPIRDLLKRFLSLRGYNVRLATDVHSAQALARLMEQHGYPVPVIAASVWKAMESVEDSLPDVVVFSLYYPNVDPLLFCRALKQAHPLLPIMVITSPGASLEEIEALGVLAGGLDAVLEQPLDEARFLAALQEVLAKRKLLSSSSVREAAHAISIRHSSVELAARTILFTDVRGSTQLLETTTTQTFFKALNHKLTQQCAAVRKFSGDVVKFTGDGLMASFQGFDRLTQAFQCALKILELEKEHVDQLLPMPVGQGLCDGLVVCAFVGEERQERPDIFGRPVHLAARLCGHAPAGTFFMKKKDFDRIDANGVPHMHAGYLEFRGVKDPVECVLIGLPATTEPLHHG